MGNSQQKNGEVITANQIENPSGNVQFGADPSKNQKVLEKSLKKSTKNTASASSLKTSKELENKDPKQSLGGSLAGKIKTQRELQNENQQSVNLGDGSTLQLTKKKKSVRMSIGDDEKQPFQQPMPSVKAQNSNLPTMTMDNYLAGKIGSTVLQKSNVQQTPSKKPPEKKSSAKDIKKGQPSPKSGAGQQGQKKRKMREVTDAKKAAFFKATSRVISMDTVKKSDLMLCVKENQNAVAVQILQKFQLVDIVDLRGQEEYFTMNIDLEISAKSAEVNPYLTKTKLEKTYNTKLWNPLAFAFYMGKQDFLNMFYDSMNLHLSHSMDVNPGKFDVENTDQDSQYFNKGKMQGLLFSVYQKNWNIFIYGLTQSQRYLSGWHIFAAIRAFVECEWLEGLQQFLPHDIVFNTLRAIPPKNRADLIDNIRNFGYMKGNGMGEFISMTLEEHIDKINSLENKYKAAITQTTTDLYNIIMADNTIALENFTKSFQFFDYYPFTGKHYKGKKELYTSYKSPVDMKMEAVRDEQFNAYSLMIVSNAIKCLDFVVTKTNCNLFYAFVKPDSYYYNDTCLLKNQIFPITYTIVNEKFEMFQYIIENLYSLFRAEHLKLILDEVIESCNPTLIEYILQHPRTHVLFNYLSYVDRQLLLGYFLISKDPSVVAVFEDKFLQRPFIGPFVFYIISNNDIVREKFRRDFVNDIDDDDIAEYIAGVSSNQAMYVISEIIISGAIDQVDGMEEFIDKIENHYAYF